MTNGNQSPFSICKISWKPNDTRKEEGDLQLTGHENHDSFKEPLTHPKYIVANECLIDCNVGLKDEKYEDENF